MKDSGIGWTDDTYNIIRVKGTKGFYCARVSRGCKFCYAETINARFNPDTHVPYKVMKTPPELELREDVMAKWGRKKKPRLNFVASMTDVFGEFVPKEWIFKMLDAMVAAPRQVFQVLTKRDVIMRDTVNEYCLLRGIEKLPANIWLGVSVEDQENAKRIVSLWNTRCSIRFISAEPLVGPLDITQKSVNYSVPTAYTTDGRGIEWTDPGDYFIGINWLICGGESGNKEIQPMHPDWARSLRDQCKKANVAYFFKQWGEWVSVSEVAGKGPHYKFPDGATVRRVGKEAAGNTLDGEKIEQFPPCYRNEYVDEYSKRKAEAIVS